MGQKIYRFFRSEQSIAVDLLINNFSHLRCQTCQEEKTTNMDNNFVHCAINITQYFY